MIWGALQLKVMFLLVSILVFGLLEGESGFCTHQIDFFFTLNSPSRGSRWGSQWGSTWGFKWGVQVLYLPRNWQLTRRINLNQHLLRMCMQSVDTNVVVFPKPMRVILTKLHTSTELRAYKQWDVPYPILHVPSPCSRPG